MHTGRILCTVKYFYFCQLRSTFVIAFSHFQEAFLWENELASVKEYWRYCLLLYG